MKNVLTVSGAIIVASVFLTSCSKKPEDACACIQKAANDFMVKGVKMESIDDLREPCKDLIDRFKEDATGRAMIIEAGTKTLESMKNKELIKIEGEELPVFPSYTFQTLSEFIDLTKADGGIYKYWKTEVTINDAYIGPIESENETVYGTSGYAQSTSDITGRKIGVRFPKSMVKPDFTKSINLPLFYGLFDGKTNNFIKYDSEINGDIADVISHQIEYPNGDGWVETSYRDKLKNIINHSGYENFVEDLKNGRYLWLSEDDIKTLRNNDFNGKEIRCLTNMAFTGNVQYNSHEWLYIEVKNIISSKDEKLPKIFDNRSKIDVSRFLSITDND
jgi:hypothetical protein